MNFYTYHHIVNRETECIMDRKYNVRCAKEIEPFIRKYFEKFRAEDFQTNNITDSKIDNELHHITEIVYYLSLNTINGRKLEKRELKALEAIFNLVYEWFDDVTQKGNFHDIYKILCIQELLEINHIRRRCNIEHIDYERIRKQMMFEDYEDLYKVIKRINDEWEDLILRGFESYKYIDVFESVLRITQKGRTEKEKKVELFMGLLDGKLKFMPVYSKVSYDIVPISETKKIIKENGGFLEYSLKEKE